jgi:carbonic anhydrase
MAKGPAFFRPFGSAETPRATVVTCTDSRVQTSSFDSSPDNDDYTVRNLGNQIDLGLGSVQYGIDHLNTPVLLILGHTGCEAIQAAANDGHGFEEPIRRELSGLRTKKQKGRLDDKHWASAVEDNVHDQVKAALKRFGSRVTSGELTIIGAIYDFRNDMMRGPGKLVVVDVNGNRDESRLKAFGEAILSTPNPKKKPGPALNPLDRLAQALSESANFDSEDEDDFEEGEEGEAAPAPAPAAAPKAAAMPAERAHH